MSPPPPPPARSNASARTPREASPQRAIQAAIQANAFDPVYYLHGDDEYLKEAAVQELLNAAIDPSTRDFNCEFRRASDLDAESVSSLLGTPPMLAERRAVVIRDVTALKKAPRAQLDRYLTHPASDTLVILTSPAGAKVDSEIASQSMSLSFEPLSPERVRRWIAHHASTVLHIDIAEDAIRLLQQAVGNDLHLLSAELDKCASYVRGAIHAGSADEGVTIDQDAVSAVVGVRRGETVTDLLDAVAQRNGAKAIALVSHVLSQPKVNAVQVVLMLATQALAISFGRARRDAGVPTNRLPTEFFAFLKETAGYPGRPWGEAASAWTRVVDQWQADDCSRALTLLLEADIALKESSVSNPEQILSTLVLGLCTPRTRGRRAA